MIELLRYCVWPFCAALVVTLMAGPVVRRLAIALDFYDRPDGGLKPHDRPIPYLGGAAIYLGWVAALVAIALAQPSSWIPFAFIGAGGTILMLTGLVDDRRHVAPRVRLAIQAAVAVLLLVGDVGRRTILVLLLPLGDVVPDALIDGVAPIVAAYLFSAIVIAAASNSTNLIDGMDGLCAGVVAVAAAGFVAVAWSLTEMQAMSMWGGVLILAICAALLGSCTGFLFFNFNPASMFMGDSGSLLLGFSVATVLILFAEHAAWRGFAGASVVFGFPFFDTALALGRRALNGRPLFVGDRSHFYDQIRDRGFSVRQTVLICYAVAAGFAALGVFVTRLSETAAVAVVIVLPAAAAIAARQFGLLRVDGLATVQSAP